MPGGTLGGLTLTNQFDTDLRRSNATLKNGATTLCQALYTYDNASQLASVSDGSNVATNTYLAYSSLVGQIGFKASSVTRMTTSKQYDFLNRLNSISSTPSNSFTYQYNAANQRTMNQLADGSYWRYGYDALGQVTLGNKYWVDETIVAGQQFDYTFDTIGNRTQTLAGGDQNGVNLRLANYTNNSLNQITSRGVPAAVDIFGNGLATNGVTVNGTTAYRKNEYFRQQLSVTNTSAAVWDSVTVAATGQTSVTGHAYVAETPENYNYDVDGNLLSDGRWTYTWDGENRLVGLKSLTGAPSGSLLQLAFAYDYMGRRIQKTVYTNNGTSYIGEYTNKYAYDGWNCVAVLNPSLVLSNSFMWGSDLSGSIQGAGGVGGLLKVTYYGATTTNCFVAYDGNGNVSALINAADGTTSATYEYGPFGEVLRATGPMAKLNPFTFGTYFYDWETDKYYAKNRYYDPSPSKWLSRDPFTEPGFYLLTTGHQASENSGPADDSDSSPNLNDFLTASSPNVYAFVDNDAVNKTDPLGLVIVAFYGADYWGSGDNGGANPEIRRIAQAVGAAGPYRSLDIWDPYQYLLNYFRNGQGSCNNNEPIKIFGHSWGGISAVKLSRWLGRSELRNHEIDVYTIDPVRLLRLPPTSVPSNVKYFWNRYQTGGGAILGPIALHGHALTSYAQISDQLNLNPGPAEHPNHVDIVYVVANELIGKLKQ